MTVGGEQSVRVVSVAAADRRRAFALIFRGLVDDDQIDHVGELLGGGDHAGLLGAYRHKRLVGAVYSQQQPGSVAMLWFPRLVADESAATTDELLRTACARLTADHVRVVQCLLREPAPAEVTALEGTGFRTISKLFYLASLIAETPATPPATDLEFEAYSGASHQRLVQVVEDTYQNTLDCPALNGVRPTAEVLAGYRASGQFDPSRWLLVRHAGEDVGCLLLADYPEQENWELVYMGVRPAWRGRGWGVIIARHAQWLARQAGRPRLVLAVDAANAPAIAMYGSVGFRAWDQRTVFLRIFSEMGAGGASDLQA